MVHEIGLRRPGRRSHGISPFNSSPGMFGKFSIIPNRQLTHLGITDLWDHTPVLDIKPYLPAYDRAEAPRLG